MKDLVALFAIINGVRNASNIFHLDKEIVSKFISEFNFDGHPFIGMLQRCVFDVIMEKGREDASSELKVPKTVIDLMHINESDMHKIGTEMVEEPIDQQNLPRRRFKKGRYPDDVKNKAIELALSGKNVEEISELL